MPDSAGRKAKSFFKRRILGPLCFGAITACVICNFPSAAQADTVYSNLGSDPSNSYVNSGLSNSLSGQPFETLSGYSNLIDGQTFEAVAVPFTPGGDFQLSQIDVAIQFLYGPGNNPGVIMGLYADSNGLPGATALASWSLAVAVDPDSVSVPTHFTCCLLDMETLSGVTVQGGEQYWIVATPWASNTTDTWEYSNGVQSGGWLVNIGAPNSISPGSWTYVAADAPMPAFDVLGTPVAAPEPPTTLLLVIGFFLLAIVSRIYRTGAKAHR